MDVSKMCEGLQITDNKTCAEIQTKEGFQYVLPSDILNCITNLKCEQRWYSEDGHLIAQSHRRRKRRQRRIDPVISVSSDHLVTSRCVNLCHQIICHSADGTPFIGETTFRVTNQTAVTPNSDVQNEATPDLQSSDQFRRRLPIICASLLLLLFFSSSQS